MHICNSSMEDNQTGRVPCVEDNRGCIVGTRHRTNKPSKVNMEDAWGLHIPRVWYSAYLKSFTHSAMVYSLQSYTEILQHCFLIFFRSNNPNSEHKPCRLSTDTRHSPKTSHLPWIKKWALDYWQEHRLFFTLRNRSITPWFVRFWTESTPVYLCIIPLTYADASCVYVVFYVVCNLYWEN